MFLEWRYPSRRSNKPQVPSPSLLSNVQLFHTNMLMDSRSAMCQASDLFYIGHTACPSGRWIVHAVVMFDEIVAEKRTIRDPKTNRFLDIWREQYCIYTVRQRGWLWESSRTDLRHGHGLDSSTLDPMFLFRCQSPLAKNNENIRPEFYPQKP